MSINYRSFMGITTPTASKNDKLLNDMFEQVVKYLNCTPRHYKNFRQFVEESESHNSDSLYFWEWMSEKGFDLIRSLDKRLPDVEEIVEFFNYRKVVLEMDYDSESTEMLLLSISEFLIATSDFLANYFETVATTEGVLHSGEFTIAATTSYTQKNSWMFVKSSAEDGAELLLYKKIREVYLWISQKLMKNTFYLKQMYS